VVLVVPTTNELVGYCRSSLRDFCAANDKHSSTGAANQRTFARPNSTDGHSPRSQEPSRTPDSFEGNSDLNM
jgi:hypothetical protein